MAITLRNSEQKPGRGQPGCHETLPCSLASPGLLQSHKSQALHMSQWLDRGLHLRLADWWGWRPDTPSLISCALRPPPGQQPIHLGQRLSSPAEASLLSVKMSLAHADWSYLSFGGSLCGHHSAGRPGSQSRPPECKPPPLSFPPPPGGIQPRPVTLWICLSQQNL